MKKILALVMAAIVVLGLVALAGCGNDQENEVEKLVLATSADFPPYEFMDGSEYAGIDIEVAGIIAEKLGRELVVENMNFNSVINSVQANKADIGMSGITVTDERKESVNFTDPYTKAVQVIVVREDSIVKSVDDLSADGPFCKIGVQLSTTGDIYISGDIADKKINGEVEQYTTGAEAIQALVSGKIDCVVIDNEPAKSFVKANDGLKILEAEYAVEDYAIAISKDDTQLLADVNKILAEIKADGTLQKIIDKHIPAE